MLLVLSAPSFTLLYSMDEIAEPKLSLKILGHQWFWSYEISDFSSCLKKNKSLKYTCYMMVLDGLPQNKYGYFRLLETNRRVVLPTNTHMRLLVSAADVLHSWTIPSFGLKVDACPGRLNQVNLFIKRSGVFYGQCSEICGVNHGFMPIVVVALPELDYHIYVAKKFESTEKVVSASLSETENRLKLQKSADADFCEYLKKLTEKYIMYSSTAHDQESEQQVLKEGSDVSVPNFDKCPNLMCTLRMYSLGVDSPNPECRAIARFVHEHFTGERWTAQPPKSLDELDQIKDTSKSESKSCSKT